MSFYLEEEVEAKFGFNYSELAKRIVEFCLEYSDFPYEAEVNLTLTDNNGIHEINKEFRNIDRPTDVLSFPMLQYEAPGDFSFLEDENSDDFNPDTGEAMLGDIVIELPAGISAIQLQDLSRFEKADGSIDLDFAEGFSGTICAVAKWAGVRPVEA